MKLLWFVCYAHAMCVSTVGTCATVYGDIVLYLKSHNDESQSFEKIEKPLLNRPQPLSCTCLWYKWWLTLYILNLWRKTKKYVSNHSSTLKHSILSQSTVVCCFIMWSNIVRYFMNDYRNWGRISIRCWIHKRHTIPLPNGRAMGCLLWLFVRKLTPL